jgi:hypothetical protein
MAPELSGSRIMKFHGDMNCLLKEKDSFFYIPALKA